MTIPGVKGEGSARFRYKPFRGKIRYFEIGANYSKARWVLSYFLSIFKGVTQIAVVLLPFCFFYLSFYRIPLKVRLAILYVFSSSLNRLLLAFVDLNILATVRLF